MCLRKYVRGLPRVLGLAALGAAKPMKQVVCPAFGRGPGNLPAQVICPAFWRKFGPGILPHLLAGPGNLPRRIVEAR